MFDSETTGKENSRGSRRDFISMSLAACHLRKGSLFCSQGQRSPDYISKCFKTTNTTVPQGGPRGLNSLRRVCGWLCVCGLYVCTLPVKRFGITRLSTFASYSLSTKIHSELFSNKYTDSMCAKFEYLYWPENLFFYSSLQSYKSHQIEFKL